MLTADALPGLLADPHRMQVLAAIVHGDRLQSLPASASRRREVLAHLAGRAFEPGRDYDEPAVNEQLRDWCDGSEVDHAAVRRYLVEAGLLVRGSGVYRLASDAPPPEPSRGERLVRGLGLS